MAQYPYIVLPSEKRIIPKSLIKVSLGLRKTRKTTLPMLALIDSGADVCLCAQFIGEWLGISFEKISTETFTAVNNTHFSAKKRVVTLYGCGKAYTCPFYFTDSLPRQTPIILGQFGFFDHFKVTFDFKREYIEII